MTAIAVTIAGSDSSGGAGIQADLKTFAALGVYGASIITALTAQNTKGVSSIADIAQDFIQAQFDAVFSDLQVGAVKIGMLSKYETIETVAASLERYKQTKIVLDPVMVATSGDRLLKPDAIDALKRVLIPRAILITPNLPEAAALLEQPIAIDENAMRGQAERLIAAGAQAVAAGRPAGRPGRGRLAARSVGRAGRSRWPGHAGLLLGGAGRQPGAGARKAGGAGREAVPAVPR